jgi:hypothetical protein
MANRIAESIELNVDSVLEFGCEIVDFYAEEVAREMDFVDFTARAQKGSDSAQEVVLVGLLAEEFHGVDVVVYFELEAVVGEVVYA